MSVILRLFKCKSNIGILEYMVTKWERTGNGQVDNEAVSFKHRVFIRKKRYIGQHFVAYFDSF